MENLGTLGVPLGLENPRKTQGKTWKVSLGLEALGKSRENVENLGSLGVPLGLGILGKTRENLGATLGLRENLENLGTLGLPLGLGILGKTRKNPGASLGLENLKRPGKP